MRELSPWDRIQVYFLKMETSQSITPYTQQQIVQSQPISMQPTPSSQYVQVSQVPTMQQPPPQQIIQQPPQQQIIPVQPLAYSSPPTVLQPIVIPQTSNNSINKERSSSIEQVNTQQITVNTSKLGDLYSILFSITNRPVNAYCTICRSVNVTYTERKVGCCAYPLFESLF